MPYITIPNQSLLNLLSSVQADQGDPIHVVPYVNTPPISQATVLGDFTLLPSDSFSGGDFTPSVNIDGDTAAWTPTTLVINGAVGLPGGTNVNGFVILSNADTYMIGCSSFATPIDLSVQPVVIFLAFDYFNAHA